MSELEKQLSEHLLSSETEAGIVLSVDYANKLQHAIVTAEKMVNLLDKLMVLCDVEFIVTIDGKPFRVNVGEEMKQALAALETE